ncbi:MAG: terminase, partial [Acinetobacter sp.]
VLQTKFDEKLPDMPDQVKSKLLVALGKATIKQIQSKDEPSQSDIAFAQEAHAHLERAIELDDKCGGKQDLKTVESLLKKFTPQEQTQPNAGESSPT